MKIKNVDFLFLLFLITVWSFSIFITVLAIKIAVPFIFLLKYGEFYFSWKTTINYSFIAGLSAGVPLGTGIWVMSWIKVRKEKNLPPKE